MRSVKLSVVVPTLDEAANLTATLASVPAGVETIVSDGGSTDATLAAAARHGARVISGSPGRAVQMNRGAVAATGDVLLFLHADCRLGPRAVERIDHALSQPHIVGGSFRLRIDDGREQPSLRYRIIGRASNARARLLAVPYGDQGLFFRADAFASVGGYPNLPFMEDVELVRRTKRLGKLVQVDETVTTGARHWRELGAFTTTVLNWTMVTLFLAGVPAERLAPFYFRLRGKRRAGAASASAYV